MTITGQSSLPKDDIDRMVRDAEAHAEDDRRRREEAEVRNNADTLVYQTEKMLRDQGDKFTGDEKDRVEAALKALKEALQGSDVEAITPHHRVVGHGLAGVRAAPVRPGRRRQNASAGAGGAGTSGSSSNDDEVVDAEIVDEPGSAQA